MSARGGSCAETCPGGHIGPPLRGVGRCSEPTEIGAGRKPSPTGRDGARPLREQQSRAVYGGVRLGCGFRQPNFGTKFGASVMGIGPYAPRGDEGRHAGVVVPYGWLRRVAAIARASGAQRSVCGADGRNGRESQQRSSPKCPATPDNPSVTAFGRASSLCTREPLGTGDADRRNQRPKFWDKIWLAVATP